jgi:hypothetical protein
VLLNRSIPTVTTIPVLNQWTFSQTIADIDPGDWGGILRE